MARRDSTPDTKKEVMKVRRRYKKNIKRNAVIRPGEREFILATVCTLKLARYPNTQIAKIIGISRQQVAELLDDPQVAERLIKIQENLPAAALEIMEGYSIEAVQALVDVMRTTDDDNYRIKAATEILDRTGIPKVSRQERKTEHEENVNITDDGLLDKLRGAPPEVQEEAAQIIESLETLLAVHAQTTTEIEGDGSDET